MRIIKRFFRNINIFLLAGIFSLAIIFLIKSPNLFQASVLNAGEIAFIKKNLRDIAFKQNDALLDIFFNTTISNNPVTLVFAHDKSIVLPIETLSGQCPFTVIDANQEETTITLNCTNFDSTQSVLLLPFSGNTQDILLEEAYSLVNGEKRTFSIGNLSVATQHNN